MVIQNIGIDLAVKLTSYFAKKYNIGCVSNIKSGDLMKFVQNIKQPTLSQHELLESSPPTTDVPGVAGITDTVNMMLSIKNAFTGFSKSSAAPTPAPTAPTPVPTPVPTSSKINIAPRRKTFNRDETTSFPIVDAEPSSTVSALPIDVGDLV
jgi:hypothetical protein